MESAGLDCPLSRNVQHTYPIYVWCSPVESAGLDSDVLKFDLGPDVGLWWSPEGVR